MPLVHVAQKADLIYGRSGLRKTSNLGLAAKWVWNKFKKRTRLVTADPGGYDVLKPLVVSGLIEPWVLIGRPNLIGTMEKACEGYWPEDISDPNSPLAPPEATDWGKIGLYAFEGLTSFGDQALLHLQDTKASLSQDPSYLWADGDRVFAGGNKAYFGLVQTRIYAMVIKSHMLACEKVIWTALEGIGEEDRVPVYGPAIVGRQSTGKATQWFGNSVHIEGQLVLRGLNKDTNQEEFDVVPYMYVTTHADAQTKMKYQCKHRAPLQFANEMPKVLPQCDIGWLYTKLDELNEKARMSEGLEGAEELAKSSLLPISERPKPRMAAGVVSVKTVPVSVPVGQPVPVQPVPAPPVEPAKTGDSSPAIPTVTVNKVSQGKP